MASYETALLAARWSEIDADAVRLDSKLSLPRDRPQMSGQCNYTRCTLKRMVHCFQLEVLFYNRASHRLVTQYGTYVQMNSLYHYPLTKCATALVLGIPNIIPLAPAAAQVVRVTPACPARHGPHGVTRARYGGRAALRRPSNAGVTA